MWSRLSNAPLMLYRMHTSLSLTLGAQIVS